VLGQLQWLHDLGTQAPALVVVASHDDEQRRDLVQRGVLGGRFE
jgi:hypothetical protein